MLVVFQQYKRGYLLEVLLHAGFGIAIYKRRWKCETLASRVLLTSPHLVLSGSLTHEPIPVRTIVVQSFVKVHA